LIAVVYVYVVVDLFTFDLVTFTDLRALRLFPFAFACVTLHVVFVYHVVAFVCWLFCVYVCRLRCYVVVAFTVVVRSLLR